VLGAGELLAMAWRGAGELIADNRVARRARATATAAGGGALAAATARPGRVLAVALGVAVLGWGLDTQTHVESDIQKLVPQNLPALSDLQALQKSTGVGGELDVVVDGDLTDPAVVGWMARYQKDILARYRYSAAARLRQGRGVPRVLAARPAGLRRRPRHAHADPGAP